MTIAKFTNVACIVSTGDGCFLKWLINEYEINSKKGRGGIAQAYTGDGWKTICNVLPPREKFQVNWKHIPAL